jgi:hypothetical protein
MQPPSRYSVSPLWSFCTTACGPHLRLAGCEARTLFHHVARHRGVVRTQAGSVHRWREPAWVGKFADPHTAGTAAMKKPLDEPPKTWCGTCGCKFYGCGTNCPACREREERRKALAAGTGAAPAGEQSHGRRETSRTERRP